MIASALTMLQTFRIQDILDIAIISVMISALLIWFKDRASRFVFLGSPPGSYISPRPVLPALPDDRRSPGFFAILLFVLVVIFQEDLRRFFERLAMLGRFRRNSSPRRLKESAEIHRRDGRPSRPQEELVP